MRTLKIAATGAVLIAFLMSGCATVTQRFGATELAAFSDQDMCLLGLKTTAQHPDARLLQQEYQGRLLAGRFTHQQCMARQAQQYAATQAASDADIAALGSLAYQLGQAI